MSVVIDRTREVLTPPIDTPVIYIAGPFRSGNCWDTEQNVRQAEELAINVWRALGCAAICPHSNTRFSQGVADDRVFLNGYLSVLLRCDAVLVTPRWQESEGSIAEVEFARTHGIPVFLSFDELAAAVRSGNLFIAGRLLGPRGLHADGFSGSDL